MKELTQEQQDKLDFTPTEAEIAYVDAMAATVQSDMKNKRTFEGQRNRASWKRMNRPSKTAMIDKGAYMINRLIAKGIALNPLRKVVIAAGNMQKPTNEGIESNPTSNDMTGP